MAQSLTQAQLAQKVGVVPRTVSKWECGQGIPDITLVTTLSEVLSLSLPALLSGACQSEAKSSGNLSRAHWYYCPRCGTLSFVSGNASIVCCDHPLFPLVIKPCTFPVRAERDADELLVSGDHAMDKSNYVAFVALQNSETIIMRRLYPESDFLVRIPVIRRAKLLVFSTSEGLSEVPWQC